MPTRDGIDVSHYQNDNGGGGANAIKWNKVLADGAKYSFVKISEKTSADPYGKANLKNGRSAGLLVRGYHFMRNTASGADQAKAFLDNVELKSGDLLPALDVEITPSSASAKKALVDKCREWVDIVSQEIGGKSPFIYTRKGVWDALGNPNGKFKTCPLWIARYGPPPQIPAPWTSYVVWQFSQSGSIDGITGDVDENTLGVSFTALKSKYTI